MRTVISLLAIIFSSSLMHAQVTDAIRLNQVGYFPGATKLAVLVGPQVDNFYLIDQEMNQVFGGDISAPVYWPMSGEHVQVMDFSHFNDTGMFRIQVSGVGVSHPFKISVDAYDLVVKESVRYFYYNRCSYELEEQYAGIYARAAGHPDELVYICDNPYPGGRPVNVVIKSSGGWYDAGDYNKYLLTAGISTYTLLSAYEQYPQYITSLSLNIPESDNAIPDLLDECLYELRWLFTMQDLDGGVFTKLTNKDFGGFQMPDAHGRSNGKRYVCQKNTSATLQFAALMAAAWRIYSPVDSLLPGFRDSCLTAAVAAWDWALKYPSVDAGQCGCGIVTGAYGDDSQSDEFVWASAELYLATGDTNYYNYKYMPAASIKTPAWRRDKEVLGFISLLLNEDRLTGPALKQLSQLKDKFRALSDSYVSLFNQNPYRIIKSSDWQWGSNGDASNQSFVVLTAYRILGDRKYLTAGMSNIDYVLGKNPTGYCWLTGFGGKRVYNAHHRASGSDKIKDPVPGMVFGGAYEGVNSFKDNANDYAMTEVTINWNAPFAFSAMAIQANNGKKCWGPSVGRPVVSLCDTSVSFPLTLESGDLVGGNYQWYKNGVEIPGGDSHSYILEIQDTGYYEVVRDSAGCIRADAVEVTTLLPAVRLGAGAGLQDDSLALNAGIAGVGYRYEWYRDGAALMADTLQTIRVADCNSNYKVVVTAAGCDAVMDSINVYCGQSPFNGEPALIPGTIQAEDYDVAWIEGAAYLDSTAGNSGNVYRYENVDVEACYFCDFNLTDIQPGEWVEYTVDVTAAGRYAVDFYVTGVSDGKLRLALDGQYITDTVFYPAGKSTVFWDTIRASGITLSPGEQVLRFEFYEGGFKLDKFEFGLESMIDCNQNLSGSAFIDSCGYCVGGATGRIPNYSGVDCSAGIAPIDLASQYVLGPNPVADKLQLNKEFTGAVSIVASNGQTFSLALTGARNVDLSSLAPGVYMLRFKQADAIFHYKVLKL